MKKKKILMRDLDRPGDSMPEDLASETRVAPTSSRTKTTRWAIRVTYPDGREAWLRHGASIGEGPVVRFGTKKLAEINAEFVSHGLPEGTTVTVVRRLS
jgi:hypothetical protein